MLMSTVVAVAIGVAPLKQGSAAETVAGDFSNQIGTFSQRVDRRGSSYEITLDRRGNVEANIGDSVVTFRVQDAS